MPLKNKHLPLQDLPKFTQIWIFGLKICHLARLRAPQRFPALLKIGANIMKKNFALFSLKHTKKAYLHKHT
jgi:hypothetical protein